MKYFILLIFIEHCINNIFYFLFKFYVKIIANITDDVNSQQDYNERIIDEDSVINYVQDISEDSDENVNITCLDNSSPSCITPDKKGKHLILIIFCLFLHETEQRYFFLLFVPLFYNIGNLKHELNRKRQTTIAEMLIQGNVQLILFI